MKKAYVRVKPKSVKKSFGKVYIIAAGLSAVLCATVFSFILRPDEDITKDIKIEVTDEKKEEEIVQVSEPVEIEIPVKEEIKELPEIEIGTSEQIEEKEVFASSDIKMMMPVSGNITNEYSGKKPVKSKTMGDWRVHSGIDIEAPSGQKVCAPLDGKVISCENSKLTGNTVSIEHKNGFVSTLYNLGSISVEEGTELKTGDAIGTIGNSSALESLDAPHVHFELKKDGVFVNPRDYIK